ncbi:hypothetical protein ElyMa_001733900 [Elysia marginata]|uniref:MD-2-related lipid-recognition domain-containing protein n=1 Tax=Elysia marginata TaxID=1093978 RepID=A0AAV4JVT7_9GAST|nr:hypothetical protein ElyMa_001733900 [Elysia marginata]
MRLERSSLLIKAVALVTVGIVVCDEDQTISRFTVVEDAGYATNCGSAPFNLSWTPKVLSPFKPINMTVVFRLPYELDGGSYNVVVTQYGMPDPFITFTNQFTCAEVKKYMECPAQKGYVINKTLHMEHTEGLTIFLGRFIMKAELKNRAGKLLLCANLDFTVNN